MNFDNVLLSVITHRGLELRTQQCIQTHRWALTQIMEGLPDLPLARCLQLHRAMKAGARNRQIQYVLLLDDDIVFTEEHVRTLLINQAQDRPISGRYLIGSAEKGFRPAEEQEGERYVTGCGFLLVPYRALVGVANECEHFMYEGETVAALAVGGPKNGSWEGEDYNFCRRWGGVDLCQTVKLGHIKKTPIWPGD